MTREELEKKHRQELEEFKAGKQSAYEKAHEVTEKLTRGGRQEPTPQGKSEISKNYREADREWGDESENLKEIKQRQKDEIAEFDKAEAELNKKGIRDEFKENAADITNEETAQKTEQIGKVKAEYGQAFKDKPDGKEEQKKETEKERLMREFREELEKDKKELERNKDKDKGLDYDF